MREETNNFQDKAEEREFAKGERAGSAKQKSAYKGKSQRRSNRSNRRSSSGVPSSTNCNGSRKQDFAWYNKYPRLSGDAARIDFAQPLGAQIDGTLTTVESYQGQTLNPNGHGSLPGLMTLHIIPSVGYSATAGSPINASTRAIFSYLRQSRSGTAPYEPADVAMVLQCVADVYSYINWGIRAYAKATMNSVMNKYLPIALLESEGFDAEDIIKHRSDFRYNLNYLITKASAMKLPSSFSIFQRRAFLYSEVYSEGVTIRDQMYQYSPVAFSLLVDGTAENPATSTKLFSPMDSLIGSTPVTSITTEQYFGWGIKMIDSILHATSSAFSYIQADILNAFGSSGYVQLALVPDEVALVVSNNTDVLYQIKNSRAVTSSNDTIVQSVKNSAGLTQVTDIGLSFLKSMPTYTATGNSQLLNALALWKTPEFLDVPTAVPSIDQIVEYSRLWTGSAPQYGANGYTTTIQVTGGSELVMYYSITKMNATTGAVANLTFGNVQTPASNAALQMLADIKSFDFAPCVILLTATDTTTSTVSGYFWDFDNYAAIDTSMKYKLDEVSLLSLFSTPTVSLL